MRLSAVVRLTFTFMVMVMVMVRVMVILAPFMATLTACGPEPERHGVLEQRIINGEACDENAHPSAAGIIVDGVFELPPLLPPTPVRTVLCTGTLIAPDVVLTAAHCMHPALLTGGFGTFRDTKYYISFASDLTAFVLDPQQIQSGTLPELPEDAVGSTAWIPHPDFKVELLQQFKGGLTNLYDLAVIFLDRAVDQPEPAVVITADEAGQLAQGVKVNIAGWGQQTGAAMNPFQPPPPGTVGQKICAESFINELGEHEMQIGKTAEDPRKCHGDSGGPSYMTVQTDLVRTERVVGITSHAYDQTDCTEKGGVDTRVDAWLGWIDQMLKDGCKLDKRAWCEVQGLITPEYYEPEPDAGVAEDGGPAGDGGTTDSEDGADDGGCSLSSTRDSSVFGALLLAVLLGLGLVARRRQDG